MTKKRILIICRKPPYGSSLGREALDIALASSVFDQELSLLFMGEGVWQLKKEQDGHAIDQKNYESLLSAFPLYDINDLYVDESAMTERNLQAQDLALQVSALDQAGIKDLIASHDILLNF
jgi:tRNA 2-thiouridine synthesizing protein C